MRAFISSNVAGLLHCSIIPGMWPMPTTPTTTGLTASRNITSKFIQWSLPSTQQRAIWNCSKHSQKTLSENTLRKHSQKTPLLVIMNNTSQLYMKLTNSAKYILCTPVSEESFSTDNCVFKDNPAGTSWFQAMFNHLTVNRTSLYNINAFHKLHPTPYIH